MRRLILATAMVSALAAPALAADGPHPGTEALLRHTLADLAVGRMDFDTVTDEIARVARPLMPQIYKDVQALGAVKSITFKRLDGAGSDVYEVRFERGVQTWVISIGSDGRATNLLYEPVA
jgi:hypothetical protein